MTNFDTFKILVFGCIHTLYLYRSFDSPGEESGFSGDESKPGNDSNFRHTPKRSWFWCVSKLF